MTADISDRQAAALGWTVALLEAQRIPFQIVGGLAARAYGATRPLVDLDIYVPTSRLSEIAAAVEADPVARMIRSPAPYHDAAWNLTFLSFDYAGQLVELGGATEARYFDQKAGRWRDAQIDFAGSTRRQVLGRGVPVMPVAELIAYKRALDREVDRLDLAELDSTER